MSLDALPRAALGDLVRPSNEKAFGRKRPEWPYIGLEHLEGGSPKLLGTAHSSVSASTNAVFRQGDVLFGKLRPYLRKSVAAPFDGYCSTDLLVLRPTVVANPGFVSKVFQSERVFAKAVATSIGTKMPRTSWAALEALEVFSPPLAEQRGIAEILDTLDGAIRKTEQVIAKLQQMKQGLLRDLLTRGIDENGELRHPERHPGRFKGSPLGRIPKGWDVRPLVQVAEVRSGIAKNSNRAVGNPVWVHYLRVANVQDGFLDLSEMSQIRVGTDEVEKYAVRDGDVLMNEGGDLDKLGRGAVWRGQYDPCVHQNHVFVVRCGPALLSDFLDAWTGSSPARRYFLVAGKQTTNLASINKTALGRLPVAVPPLDEQATIVSALQLHSSRLTFEEAELAKLRALKHGLMDDLLTGRIRTPVPVSSERT